MNKTELINKLNEIEWEDFEVKEAHSEIPKNTWETVSAFANTGGGWLVFGVKKTGKTFTIVGVKNPEKMEQDFTNTLRGEKFNVKLALDCKKYEFTEGTVLAFYIPISDKKPIYFNTQANTFIRTASGDQRATKEEIDALYRNQAFGTHTSGIVANTSVNDINEQSFKRYRDYLSRFNPTHPYNRLEKEEFLQKLRAVTDGNLTYSGLFFFGKEDAIQRAVPDFRIDYLEIPGTSYSDASVRYSFRIDEQENLWEYYFAIFDRLRRYLDLPFQLTSEGFAKEDYPQLNALREALVNMLMHADYNSAARPRIRVFDNRIEFFNPGALPKSLEQIMKEDISMPRNPIIAKLFRVVKLAENAGYGFDKMIDGWNEYAGTKPEFEQGLDFTKATFYLKVKTVSPVNEAIEALDWIGFKKRLGDRLGDRLGENEWKILENIWGNPSASIPEMAEKIGISTTAIENNIKKLKEKNLLERIGSAKAGHWKIIE